MKDKLMFRPLNKEDYEIICKWWKWWRWPIIPRVALPENGECGFMVEKNNKPIVSAFLYLTNSNVALLEWIVSNPDYREDDRKEAIELLIIEAEKACKEMGVASIFSLGRNKHLMETHKKLGWQIDKKPSYEIIKILNT
tara:strand:+ start:291 stop:707 length:417 start_codon:yes stop_codon:yes gene_type:complete